MMTALLLLLFPSVTALSTKVVSGVECRPISLTFPTIGAITVLEATAQAQNLLVDRALEVEEEGDPYGAVLWPAASAMALQLIERRPKVDSILELGTGTGLVSLVAARLGIPNVYATDYAQVPLDLLHVAAREYNQLSSIHLERYDFVQDPLPHSVDLVVAADVLYEPKTGRGLALRVVQALDAGSEVWIADSPGRAGRPAFLQELASLGVQDVAFEDVKGWTVTGDRHELICGPKSTSKSIDPEELTVAFLQLKPLATR